MNRSMKGMAVSATAILALVVSVSVSHAESLSCRDKLGRTVQIVLPVRRAVLFETYELTAALDVWDRIAGISRYAYENDLILAVKPDIAETISSAGSGFDMNIETLLKYRPDLVITWSFKPETIRFMEEKGLKVIALYPESLPELYETMRLQGRLFGEERKVEQSIVEMEKIFLLVRDRSRRVPNDGRKKVIWLGGKPTTVSGGMGIYNDMICLINAVNPAFIIQERSADVSMERIVAWNPDVVFIWGSAKFGVEDLIGSPRWRHVDAVRKSAVYRAPKWSTWSPRLAVVALWMAMKTYPEVYRDIDFRKTADDFYRTVYGVPYGSVSQIED